MEFMSRGNNQAAAPQAAHNPGVQHPGTPGRRKHIDWAARTIRIEIFIVLVGGALILAALSVFLALSGGINNEDSLVKTTKYQAVFLNGGSTSGSVTYSTYFGHITNLNSKYVVLQNVYYLTTDQTSSSSSASPQLIKLGCQQLHSPYDEMIINRDQVAFWENLQDNGKVVQAIQSYIKQNPNGPNCSQATSSTGANSQSATTPSSSTSTPSTSSTGSSTNTTNTSGQ
jgi:hypothetical protein